MFNEKSTYSVLKRFWGLAIIALFCGAAICLVWRCHRIKAALAEEQSRLVDSLIDSVSAANRNSNPIRVALFDANLDDGSATKDLRRFLDAESTFVWKSVSPTDIQAGALEGFNVVIFPGGIAPQQAAVLGDDGKQATRKFVQAGGGYVGICGGAFLATAKYDWGMALVNAKPLTGKIDIPGKGMVSIAARGAGTVKMELTDAGKSVFGDSPGLLDIRYSGGPIISPAGMSDLSKYVSLAVFRTEVWEYEPQQGSMIDTPAIIAGRFGKGRVIIFSPHPEMTAGLEFLVRCAILATARTRSAQEDSVTVVDDSPRGSAACILANYSP